MKTVIEIFVHHFLAKGAYFKTQETNLDWEKLKPTLLKDFGFQVTHLATDTIRKFEITEMKEESAQ